MSRRFGLAITVLAAMSAVVAAPPQKPATPPQKPAAAAAKRPATAAAPARAPMDAFHLKPGAQGKLCLSCHADFSGTLSQPFVHTPVKKGDCTDCHSPHASKHGKMLAADPAQVCVTCHANVVPEKPVSAHPDVVKGNCTKCHDPHASKNPGNLLRAGNDLCLDCHKNLAKSITDAKFKHAPVAKSCLTCHDPHTGAKTASLLAKSVPELCVGCHNVTLPNFQKAHQNYPVGKANCTTCHDPHGSSQSGILWASVHAPVQNRMCAQCHEAANSPDALKVKKTGIDLCKSCHGNVVSEALGASRIHWPVLDRTSCLNCHNPHAGKAPKLLRDTEGRLCGSCHADAVRRAERAVSKHQPVIDGACSTCHRPHSSNTVYLLDGATVPDVCSKCHDWGKHSSHPIGDKFVDPRNPNLRVECLSCHRTHGTAFKHLAPFDTKSDLCTQCHSEMGR